MNSRVLRNTLSTLFGVFGLMPSAAAQAKLEIVPAVGLYLPTSRIIDQTVEDWYCALNCTTYRLSVEQKAGLMMGGRFIVWLPGHVGVEGAVTYSGSRVTWAGTAPGTTVTGDTTARVINMSTKILVRLTPSGSRTSFHVGGGLTMVRYGGAMYEDREPPTRIGGIVGAGIGLKVGPLLTLQFDAEDRVFNAYFTDLIDYQTERKPQNDVVLSLGLAVRLGRP